MNRSILVTKYVEIENSIFGYVIYKLKFYEHHLLEI